MAGRSTSSRLDAHGPNARKAPTSARRSGPSSSCRSGGDLVVVGDDLGGLGRGNLGRGERGGLAVGLGDTRLVTVWVPVIVALLSIAGTLSAALFTQRAAASAEAQRREATERDRWLVE